MIGLGRILRATNSRLVYYSIPTWILRGWRVSKRDDAYVVEVDGSSLYLTRDKLTVLVSEWGYFKKCYLPKNGLEGKTVVDAGAGCGESAYFFFKHGAQKVISIESSPSDLKFLRKNAEDNSWNIEIIDESFRLDHLSRQFDFMKVDVEGGEKVLLELGRLDFPCVIETHGWETTNRFIEKFGMKIIDSPPLF